MSRWAAVLTLIAATSALRSADAAEPPPPDTQVHRVAPGQVLGKIARRYGVSVAEICRANGMKPTDVLRPGRKLLIPGEPAADRGPAVSPSPASRLSASAWQAYRRPAKRRGYVTLTGHGRRWSGYVIGPKGEVLSTARKRIAWVLASWRTGNEAAVNERLIRLIARVSDEFGGRAIRVVSGYRERSHARKSRHRSGQALDFSIPGVPNDALRDYLRTLPNTGVGFYPNSTHVHLDVRDRPGYWVDLSRPGQRPSYGHRLAKGERSRGSTARRAIR